MARQIQVFLLCDPCLREDQRVEGEDFTLSIAGIAHSKPRTLTLCEVHRKEFYDPIHDLLAELGQAVDAQPKTVKAPKAAKKSTAATAVSKEAEPAPTSCPAEDCGAVLKNLQSLRVHARTQHGKTLQELRGETLAYACDVPGCDSSYSLPQHLSRHRNTAHGIAPGGSLQSA